MLQHPADILHLAVKTVRRSQFLFQILARPLQLGFLPRDLVCKPYQPLIVPAKSQFLGFVLALIDDADLFRLTVQLLGCRDFDLRRARPKLLFVTQTLRRIAAD